MTALDVALEAWPSEAAFGEVCRHVEGLSKVAVAEVAAKLRTWPLRTRPMPDRWWAERQSGGHRPWHVLATYRPLSRADPNFYVSAVACPNSLDVLLAGSGATGNNDLGQLRLFRPVRDRESEDDLLIATLAEDETAVDAVFSPDGSQVTVGFADLGCGVGPVVYGVDGRKRHAFNTEVERYDDFTCGRIAQSADGRLIAGSDIQVGTALVAEAATGTVLLRIDDAFGPVALNGNGRLLVYSRGSGRVAVRDVSSGELLSTLDTGMTTLNALAVAPDSSGVLAVGDDRPTACLMSMEQGRLTGASCEWANDPKLRMDSTTPSASHLARASWTFRGGAQAFAADDDSAVLFEAASGRVRWASDAGLTAGSFTADGRVFVASGIEDGVVDAWFLGSLPW